MSTAQSVSEAPVCRVTGSWQRHVGIRWRAQALDGRQGYGRWATDAGFPVLYLGRPRDSVVIEAYRHQVDPVEEEDISLQLAPRVLVTAEVDVSEVLDLRSAGARLTVGLSMELLTSSTGDRAAYAACQRVSEIAHQLGRHGVIAPAATEAGETLVLFTDRLSAGELPRRAPVDEVWDRLPADPPSSCRSPAKRRPARGLDRGTEAWDCPDFG